MTRRRSPSKTRDTKHGTHADRRLHTQYALCLRASHAPDADIERALEIASRAGFSCVELDAPMLEAYLSGHPVVWLDLQLRQHNLYTLLIDGLDRLPAAGAGGPEDLLVHRAHFLELCARLDALGGGTLVLHPGAGEQTQWPEVSARALRDYADLAAPFEVTLAFEFRAKSQAPDLQAALDLVQRAARSNLRLAISAREWCASGADLRPLEALEPGRLALVRLDAAPDPAPSPAGEAPDPAQGLYARLAAAGFRGPYCVALPAPSPEMPDAPGERARAARQAALDLLAPLYQAQPAP